MNVEQMKEWIADKDVAAVESAWLAAIADNSPAEQMTSVLEAMVAAGQARQAETFGWMLLEERLAQLEAPAALDLAKGLLMAVPTSEDLRRETAKLYKKVYSGEGFEAIFNSAGLLSGQSPRRALRTLDVCLALKSGGYLLNRYDGHVVQVKRIDAATGAFEVATSTGRTTELEPRALADEYDQVGQQDFRVLCQHRQEEMGALLASDPAAILIGACMSRGGRIHANDLKEWLVPDFLPADQWSGWWGRARTAAKRCPQLVLEGRSPITVVYHPQGHTLEEELSPAAAAAKSPLEGLAVLQEYLRESRGRKLEAKVDFMARLMEGLAEQAVSFKTRRPADALAAALAIDVAIKLGAPAPKGAHPSAKDVLADTPNPVTAVAALENADLWPAALDAMAQRPDGADQLQSLLPLTPSNLLDDVTQRLAATGRPDAVARAVAVALSDPLANLDVYLWVWKGPATPPSNVPTKVELLGKLLKTVQELDRQDASPRRKEFYQRIRAALGSADFASFRQVAQEMDEHVAATIKRQVERSDGLAEAVREGMLDIMKDKFPSLFFQREQIPPWLDESTVWTTEKALHRREAEYKELTDVKMLANAKAIGAAAEHGDLSENSEWKFALEERDMLKARALKMQDELSRARVLQKENVPADFVGVGSRVFLKRITDGKELTLTFLGPWEIDLENNVYSYLTRLAQDLMGKPVGMTIELKIEGAEGEYRVEKVENAL